jgi:ribosomal protein S18 acetylase RimI-like enzyme
LKANLVNTDQPKPSVRRAAVADVGALVALMRGFYAESDFALDLQWAEGSFRKLLSDSVLGCVWLAHSGAEVVGHAVLTTRYTMEHGAVSGYIDDLYVKPGFRRIGAGSALLHELFEECHTRGCKAVYVEVGGSNTPARALYQRFGLLATQDDRVLLSGVI